eukprot:scaffold92375_cov41-Prasinocladus_malaysianus.AAC.1
MAASTSTDALHIRTLGEARVPHRLRVREVFRGFHSVRKRTKVSMASHNFGYILDHVNCAVAQFACDAF